MKLALWLSLIGIVTVIVAGVVGDHSGYAIYVLLFGAALILVPWVIYGVSVVVFFLGSYLLVIFILGLTYRDLVTVIDREDEDVTI